MLISSLLRAPLQLSLTYFPSFLREHGDPCSTVESGFQCKTSISRFWGHYSPYFAVQGQIPDEVPKECEITFAQVLARHGARDPTEPKSKWYNQMIDEIQANVTSFHGHFSFLSDYVYSLGSEELTSFGEQQMFDAGIQFARRYRELTTIAVPFVRSAGTGRVVHSSEKWVHGYQQETGVNHRLPILVIPEGHDTNNTLTHGLCTKFEKTGSQLREEATAEFGHSFIPGIRRRLNAALPGVHLTPGHIISLMDLCAYETVASPGGSLMSPFCYLFTEDEWHAYNYYQSLEKYYGRGSANPLGPTQGVGFVNELLARLTNTPVQDMTSSNRTLDSDPETFPLSRKLYADFSHDNDMTSMLFALGLYDNTAPLSNHTIWEAESEEAAGFSSAWTVPFGARIYFEKMKCQSNPEEMVRVVVNGRVIPLLGCDANEQGMCTLSKFVESQSFARGGGHWDKCFSRG